MVDRKPEGDKEEDGFYNMIEYEDDVNKTDVYIKLSHTQVTKTYKVVPTSISYLKRPRCLVKFRYQIQNRSDLSYFFPINLSDLSFVNFVNFHLACIPPYSIPEPKPNEYAKKRFNVSVEAKISQAHKLTPYKQPMTRTFLLERHLIWH